MEVSPLTVLVQILNFMALYVLVLKPLVFKPLQQAMGEREATVKKSLDEAAKVALDAHQLKQQYEARLKEAATEATGIVSNAQREGERIKAETVEKAKAESQRILDKAKAEIKSEREKAISEIRGQVATLSINMARQMLVGSLDSKEQEHIVEKMLTQQAGRANGA